MSELAQALLECGVDEDPVHTTRGVKPANQFPIADVVEVGSHDPIMNEVFLQLVEGVRLLDRVVHAEVDDVGVETVLVAGVLIKASTPAAREVGNLQGFEAGEVLGHGCGYGLQGAHETRRAPVMVATREHQLVARTHGLELDGVMEPTPAIEPHRLIVGFVDHESQE